MGLIDLSYPIYNSMPVYPSDTPPVLFQVSFFRKDHYNNFRLETGMHAGTHIDSPMHLTECITTIDMYDIERFTGTGCLLDVRGQETITFRNEYSSIVKKGDIVLLYSGHSNQFGNDTYYRKYPVIDNSLAEFFCNRQIKIAGMDTPSPDIFPFEIHKILFNQGIFIIENLTNLEKLLSIKQFEVFAFPLKIKADSSPVRVVARYETTDNTPISGEVL